MESSVGDNAPRFKIVYSDEESPDMVAWHAKKEEVAALLSNAAVHVHEPGMPLGGALLGKNRTAEQRALYCNAAGFAPREHGMPFGEALPGKNVAAELGAPSAYAPLSPYAVQVSIDEAMGAKAGGGSITVETKAAGADAGDARGRGGKLSAVVGIVAASSAVTAVAAGAVSPAVTFGFFVVLLGGLSLAVSTVRGA